MLHALGSKHAQSNQGMHAAKAWQDVEFLCDRIITRLTSGSNMFRLQHAAVTTA